MRAAAALLLLVAPAALAADLPPPPAEAETPEQEEARHRYRFPLVPTFDFEGGTDGSAAVRAGIALTFAPGTPLLDITLSHGAEIESFDALKNLAGLPSGSAPAPSWAMRFGVAFVALPLPEPGRNPFADEGWTEVLTEAVQACSSVCAALPDAEGCADFEAAVDRAKEDRIAGRCAREPDFAACHSAGRACLDGGGDPEHPACRALDGVPAPSEVDVEELCAEGRARVAPALRTRVVRRYPPFLLAVGGRVGQSPFSYVEPDPAAVAAIGNFGGRLVAVESSPTRWGVGAKWAIVSGGKAPVSLEGLFSVSRDWRASTRSATWCSTEDALVQTDEGERVLRTETCDSAVLGGPTSEQAFRIGVFPGFFDRWKDFWRVAAGPELSLVWVGEAERPRVDFALRVPARVHFGRIPGKEGGTAWNALLRLEPVFRWTDLAGDGGFAVGLDFAVVGQRLLFSEEYDAL